MDGSNRQSSSRGFIGARNLFGGGNGTLLDSDLRLHGFAGQGENPNPVRLFLVGYQVSNVISREGEP